MIKMEKVLILLVGYLALVAAQGFGQEDRDAATIKNDIMDGINTFQGMLEAFTADDKKMLRDVNDTLTMERTKAELQAYINPTGDSTYSIIAQVIGQASTFINDNLKKMTIRFASEGGFLNILTKADRLDLTHDLETLKKAFDAFMVHYNKVKNAFECKLDKLCYEQDFQAAEGEFHVLWEGVEDLKPKCKTFDATCIKKFMDYKTMFETFESTKIPPLKNLLTSICDKECYANEVERFNYEKSLLKLDISASGMVAAVQFAVKHALVKRLNSITKRMHIRKEKLNLQKLAIEDAEKKEDLSAALTALKALKAAAEMDSQDFHEAFSMAIELEGKLSEEDFNHIIRQGNGMIYRISGMQSQIDECIAKVENSHSFIAFKIEVNDNEAVMLTNAEKLKEKIRRVKSGKHTLCTELFVDPAIDQTLTEEFEELRASFATSDVEFKHLKATLSKDFKELSEFEKLHAFIMQLETNNLADMNEAQKYKYFLHVYSKTHCNQVDK
eukprot:TCONS_00047511-protein